MEDRSNIIKEAIEYRKQLEKENAELKAENEILKSQLDFEVQKKEVFEIENERLKSCLQEIKAIAEASSLFIDNFKIKSATEVEYDYAAICNKLELRLHKVLELITKAESEEV